MKLVLDPIRRWLDHLRKNHLLRRYGGIQQCPWCRQIVQTKPGWRFEYCEDMPSCDELTCGICGGTSLWMWAIGFVFVEPRKPPTPLSGEVKDLNFGGRP